MSNSLVKLILYPDSSDPRVACVAPPLEMARRDRGLLQTYYITIACLSILEKVLPILWTTSSVLSTGPMSITKT